MNSKKINIPNITPRTSAIDARVIMALIEADVPRCDRLAIRAVWYVPDKLQSYSNVLANTIRPILDGIMGAQVIRDPWSEIVLLEITADIDRVDPRLELTLTNDSNSLEV